LFFVCLSGGCLSIQQDGDIIRPAKSLPPTTPWDLTDLSHPPHFEWLDCEDKVWSLYYQGKPYLGKPTRTFAYYAHHRERRPHVHPPLPGHSESRPAHRRGDPSGGSPQADARGGYWSWAETIAFLHRHLDR